MLDDRPHPGKEPVITIEAKAWLTSLTMQSNAHQSPRLNSLLTGKLTGNFVDSGPPLRFSRPIGQRIQSLAAKFPTQRNREFSDAYQGMNCEEQGI